MKQDVQWVKKSMLVMASGVLALGLSQTATAAAPYSPDLVKNGNRWLVTAYRDDSPSHVQLATQGICFVYLGVVGTHQRYRWWSDTFPDWNGIATQEGDQITMHGDYANNVGHDGFTWEIVTTSEKTRGAGHWWEWRENSGVGTTIGFANAEWQRVGKCRIAEHETANIAYLQDDKGEFVVDPSGMFRTDLKLDLDLKVQLKR